MHDFRYLDVWNVAADIAVATYAATSSFPSDERFGMVQQLRRSAASISANIAEGSATDTGPGFRRYLVIARASAAELESHMIVCQRVGFIDEPTLRQFSTDLSRVRAMITGLYRTL